MTIPPDVTTWVCNVFRECNERITEKFSNNPNIAEESLDLTWIEHLSQYASPVTLASSWTIKIETHYLGGLRHFYRWEIADIGVLLFFREGGVVRRSKVALLQSKRLYPTSGSVQEEDKIDYQIGFARIADPEMLAHSVAVQAQFEFNTDCIYGALAAKSEQVKAITAYEKKNKTPVYYQLYNPWDLPFKQRIPLSEFKRPSGPLNVGTRIIPSQSIHRVLSGFKLGQRPSPKDLKSICSGYQFGWPLEHFMADLLLGCVEGVRFKDISEERIQNLFYRRTGPIAAAIAISIESPDRHD